jgi:hypothetical protein
MRSGKDNNGEAAMNNNLVLTRMLVVLGIVSLLSLAGCGGGTSRSFNNQPPLPPPSSPAAVSVSPSSATVAINAFQQFTATVSPPGANQAVTWVVQEGAAGGSITGAGMYTAPGTPGTFHVVATSQADSTKSVQATVTITNLSLSVILRPAAVGMKPDATQIFTATVTGSSNTAVAWTIQEGSGGGTITDSGVYTAPATLGTYHVLATSAADPTMSASALAVVTQSPGSFTTTASMLRVVGIHTATLLADGKVLVAGGSEGTFNYAYGGLRDAELYDPVASSFTTTISMTSARTFHTTSLLPNGKVLVTGGFDEGHPDQPLPESSAELYDQATGSFTPAGSMGIARAVHTATILVNGKVLIAGGGTQQIVDGGFPFFGQGIAESEVYDPATNSFSATGAMSTSRFAHTATLLHNGKVLITGGFSNSDSFASTQALLTAELYDPTTGSFNPTGNMGTPRAGHTATLLENGNVLVSGGLMSMVATAVVPSAELYDPATGTFTPTGSMAEAREEHTATLLPDGRVLIVGGNSVTDTLTSAEIYDPLTGSFAVTGFMGAPRSTHTATLLPDGTVLVAGGNSKARPDLGVYSMPTGTAEIFKLLP